MRHPRAGEPGDLIAFHVGDPYKSVSRQLASRNPAPSTDGPTGAYIQTNVCATRVRESLAISSLFMSATLTNPSRDSSRPGTPPRQLTDQPAHTSKPMYAPPACGRAWRSHRFSCRRPLQIRLETARVPEPRPVN